MHFSSWATAVVALPILASPSFLLSQKALEIYRSVFTWSRLMVDSNETEQEEGESPLEGRTWLQNTIRFFFSKLSEEKTRSDALFAGSIISQKGEYLAVLQQRQCCVLPLATHHWFLRSCAAGLSLYSYNFYMLQSWPDAREMEEVRHHVVFLSVCPQTGEMEVKNPLFDDSTLHFQQLYKWAWRREAAHSEYSYNQLRWHTHSLVLSPALSMGSVDGGRRWVGGASEWVHGHLQCPQGWLLVKNRTNLGPISSVWGHILFQFWISFF